MNGLINWRPRSSCRTPKFESAFIQAESSILPAFINLISGFSLTKEINGEPHSAQKLEIYWSLQSQLQYSILAH